MSFVGYPKASGNRGPIDVAALRSGHSKWLLAHDAMLRKTLSDIGSSAVHFASHSKILRRRSGMLAGGWHRGFSFTSSKMTVLLVNRVPHAVYHEFGTGIYGPKGTPITPKRARLLRWKNPDTGKWCSAKSVKGVKPRWIGKDAARAAWGFGERKLTSSAEALARKF